MKRRFSFLRRFSFVRRDALVVVAQAASLCYGSNLLARLQPAAVIALALCFGGFSVRAQESEDVLRVNTRVVFLDALVKDKKTGEPVRDLSLNNFQVFDDGKPRTLSYFSREGDAGRRPLALVVILDLRFDGAGRFLRRAEILQAMSAALAKLPAPDEVAVLALDVTGTGDRKWLTRFTRDRAQVAAALSAVPQLIAKKVHTDGPPKGSDAPTESQLDQADEDNSEKKEGTGEIKTVNKDGSATIKYVNKDGALVTKTVNKDGSESVDIDYGFEFSAATHEAAIATAAERPNSQAVMVWVSDGIAPVVFEDRDQATASLLQTNVIFSALVTDLKTIDKFLFVPLLNSVGGRLGLSFYGSAQHVARQTGGEVVRVRRPEDYANGLNKIIGNLAARYSLGFTLGEDERDDGRMHQLEVRVAIRDAKGKPRKTETDARRGYFMPKSGETAPPQPPTTPEPRR